MTGDPDPLWFLGYLAPWSPVIGASETNRPPVNPAPAAGVSPLVVRILIHYHCHATEPYPGSEAALEATSWLMGKDLMRLSEGPLPGFALTKRGERWLAAILTTPLPA